MRYSLLLVSFLILSLQSIGQGPRPSSNPKAMAAFNEALRFYDQRNAPKALQQLEKALKIDEEFIDAWMLSAQIQMDLRDAEKAIKCFEHAVAIDPDFSTKVYFSLSKLYFELSHYDKAVSYMEEFQSRKKGPTTLDEQAVQILQNSVFAREALKKPKDFSPINLGSGVNTDMGEYYPALTGDDSLLYFTRRVRDPKNQQGFQEDFYMSRKNADGWMLSANVGAPINTIDHNEGAPTISADGRTMVFVVCEAYGEYGDKREGFGSCDLFISNKKGQKWSAPVNMGSEINSEAWETQPSLSADGKTLYFIRGFRNKSRYISGQDIWFSKVGKDGAWTMAQKAKGMVNTPGQESSVMLHRDGQTLYFSSDGHPGFGGEDIFVAYLQTNGEWGEPINLGYPINSNADDNSLTVASDGELALFASDRIGGMGGLDLYSFILPEDVRPKPTSWIKGLVVDAESGQNIEAEFIMIDLATSDTTVRSSSDPINGKFLITLGANRNFALNVSKKGYLFYSDHFQLSESDIRDKPKELIIKLQPIKTGERVVLKNVFFDTDKFVLKDESRIELDKLALFLQNNPSLRIELSGHTDSQGDDEYNLSLSDNRAKAVMNYLVDKGIDASRLIAVGYGEKMPIDTNESEGGRANNRRTEFKIL